MKAIQIKYLAATNTKPSRLKAWTEGGNELIEQLDYDGVITIQAKKLAQKLIDKMGWNKGFNTTGISGFGCLPNGDYVATLGE